MYDNFIYEQQIEENPEILIYEEFLSAKENGGRRSVSRQFDNKDRNLSKERREKTKEKNRNKRNHDYQAETKKNKDFKRRRQQEEEYSREYDY